MGHSEEDFIETLNVKNNQKVKKKKHGKFAQSADVDDFAMQVMRAKKVTKKRDFDEEERGRSKKEGVCSSWSIYIVIRSKFDAFWRYKEEEGNEGKVEQDGGESIYASNVQSKSSRSSRRLNAFEFFAGSSKKNKDKNKNFWGEKKKKKKKKK